MSTPRSTPPTFGQAGSDAHSPGDDELDVTTGSPLDDLRAELTAKLDPTVTLDVIGRPGYAVRYRVNISGDQVDKITKAAQDKTHTQGLNGPRFAALVCASSCAAILRNGEPLELGGGVVTFSSRELRDMLEATSLTDTVRVFYGSDAHVDQAARRIMAEAGWGDDARDAGDEAEADPTQ